MNILVIDPGSTSTKIGIFLEDKLFKENIKHERSELDTFKTIYEQLEYRFSIIKQIIKDKYNQITFDAIIGRGGLIHPVEGGIYEVNQKMLDDLKNGVNGQHASNLGGILAKIFSEIYNCKAFIADPVVVDEMMPVAKYSGLKGIERKSIFHALNHKATARKVAKKIGKNYEDVNFIVAHLGGGISIGIHSKGKVIDVNNALDGDGPFSPERAGGLPVIGIKEYLHDNNLTIEELSKIVSKKAGLMSYLGKVDMIEIEKDIENGDNYTKEVVQAMCYQIAKEICSLAAATYGKLDGIILTGGLAHSNYLVKLITERVSFLGKIFVEPGENEIESLLMSAQLALENKIEIKQYMEQ
jgi:butyrate kinase